MLEPPRPHRRRNPSTRLSPHPDIAEAIAAATGKHPGTLAARPVAGGCINQTYALTAPSGDRFFLKLNTPDFADNFAAETDALAAINATATVRAPAPLCHGTAGTHAFLVLEHLDLTGLSPAANTALGQALAGLHRATSPDHTFGWHCPNTIGATPQPNPPTPDWTTFFARHRIGHQLDLAAANGHRFDHADRLLDTIPALLDGHAPPPSLLHGDLWGGNAAALAGDTPVVFDPATFYGDRETDLAFTEMFGGFSSEFYQAYQTAYPLPAGHARRKPLYNLYHLLNHHNLFAGHYTAQAQHTIDTLLQT